MKKVLVIFLFGFLIGCSTKNISISPATDLNLASNSVTVKVTGQGIDQIVLDNLKRQIKGLLILSGFELDNDTGTQIYLNVFVTTFTPGNAALRHTVSFGAGRGSLLYTAEYTNQAGQTLAKMNGQERFTGTELEFSQRYGVMAAAGGQKSATEILIKEAAMHIVALAKKQEQPVTPPSRNKH